MDIKERIATLPKWVSAVEAHDKPHWEARDNLTAALARLALARDELEWIERQYDDNKPPHVLVARLYDVCCVARQLLKALEVPRG